VRELEGRYAKLLWFYPKSYRDERGEEIMATMVEASPGDRPSLGDALNVMAHGLRMRVGLTADGNVGQSLSLAALPGWTSGSRQGDDRSGGVLFCVEEHDACAGPPAVVHPDPLLKTR